MFQHFLTTLRAGIRSRSFLGVAVIALILAIASYLAGQFAGRAPQTVALDVGISSIRLVTVLLTLFWMQDLVGKEIERRTVLFALSYPLARSSYLLGRYLGILAMTLIATVILGGVIWLLVQASGLFYAQSTPIHMDSTYLLILALIVLDAAVVAAFNLLLGSFATSTLLPFFLSALFVLIARSYADILILLFTPEGGNSQQTLIPLLRVLSWLCPDLSQLDIRRSALYGDAIPWAGLGWASAQALGYTLLLLAFACLIFRRREID